MKFTKLYVVRAIALVAGLTSTVLFSWDLPVHYREKEFFKEKKNQLDYIIFEINGDPKVVKDQSYIEFVRGDLIQVKEAVLNDPSTSIEVVNVYGFKNHSPSSPAEDRDVLIDTGAELTERRWAVDTDGYVYATIAMSHNKVHGLVFLKRIEPHLSYIDIRLNDKNVVMREGDALRVKDTDKFQIEKVVTNLKDNKNIKFHIIDAGEFDKIKKYNIFITHRKYVFAKIPFLVETL